MLVSRSALPLYVLFSLLMPRIANVLHFPISAIRASFYVGTITVTRDDRNGKRRSADVCLSDRELR